MAMARYFFLEFLMSRVPKYQCPNNSFGIEALDGLIGITSGATLLHSVILFDENGSNGRYCSSIQKCFIAEGVDQGQDIFLAGPLLWKIIQLTDNLPVKNEQTENNCGNDALHNSQSMEEDHFKIAWRYKTAPLPSSAVINGNSSSPNKFDLSRTQNSSDLRKARESVHIFNEDKDNAHQPSLSRLWNEIFQHFINSKYASNPKNNGNVLRLVLSDLSSPIWAGLDLLPLFLAQLKSFCRQINVIVLISLDSDLLNSTIHDKVLQYADAVFQLQRMDEDEQIRLHLRHKIDGGRFIVRKLPAIVSTAPAHVPHSMDLLFSLRRTFFEIKLLHLPPAIGEEQTKSRMACQSIADQF